MKLFANQILSDPQSNKHIGLYQLGNNRARIGVLTTLPAIYLNNPKELKLFIKSNEIGGAVWFATNRIALSRFESRFM